MSWMTTECASKSITAVFERIIQHLKALNYLNAGQNASKIIAIDGGAI